MKNTNNHNIVMINKLGYDDKAVTVMVMIVYDDENDVIMLR